MPKYHFRAGVGGFGFYRGMNLEGNPGDEPLGEFRWLQNARLVDGFPISRGGQAKRFTTQVGSVQGIWEASDVRAAQLTEGADGVTLTCGEGVGISIEIPRRIYASNEFPGRLTYYDNTNARMLRSLLATGGEQAWLLLGDEAAGRVIFTVVPTGADWRIFGLRRNSKTPVLLFEAPVVNDMPRSIVKFGANFYITVSPGLSDDVYVWDGISSTVMTTEGTVASGLGTRFGIEFNNDIYFCRAWAGAFVGDLNPLTTLNTVSRRNGGAYSGVTIPINDFTLGNPLIPGGMVVAGGSLWLAGHVLVTMGGGATPTIIKIAADNTATVAHSLAAMSTAVLRGISQLFTDAGGQNLYYIWVGDTAPITCYLGKYDASSGVWNDTYMTLGIVQGPGLLDRPWTYAGYLDGEYYFLTPGDSASLYRTTGGDLTSVSAVLAGTCMRACAASAGAPWAFQRALAF